MGMAFYGEQVKEGVEGVVGTVGNTVDQARQIRLEFPNPKTGQPEQIDTSRDPREGTIASVRHPTQPSDKPPQEPQRRPDWKIKAAAIWWAISHRLAFYPGAPGTGAYPSCGRKC